jgi:FlaA1/EpsC-like NDP-sugar epimerase
MAGGLRTGETRVEDLVKRATSYHLTVLNDILAKLPAAALAEFDQAMSAARRVQEARPTIPSAPTQLTTPSSRP